MLKTNKQKVTFMLLPDVSIFPGNLKQSSNDEAKSNYTNGS